MPAGCEKVMVGDNAGWGLEVGGGGVCQLCAIAVAHLLKFCSDQAQVVFPKHVGQFPDSLRLLVNAV